MLLYMCIVLLDNNPMITLNVSDATYMSKKFLNLEMSNHYNRSFMTYHSLSILRKKLDFKILIDFYNLM